ncbi:MAG: TIR domain-containing protein [Isosphaeraceae bacterium]
MPSRRAPTLPQEAPLTINQMKRGISRIQKRVEELELFDPETISERWGPEVKVLQTAIDETLAAVFGHDSVKYNRYRRAADLDHGPILAGRPATLREARQYVARGKSEAIALLGQAVRGLEEEILDQESALSTAAPAEHETARDLSRVFLVHGHDGEVKEAVARFISEKLGFEPVILHERPNKGRTIITKFREEARGVGFAVVLMTADDLGKANDTSDLRLRARQNVVFELGFFIGALGPERVAAVVRGDVERPSDFDGVVYISFDTEDWRTKLGQELQEAGYKVDWNKVMR